MQKCCLLEIRIQTEIYLFTKCAHSKCGQGWIQTTNKWRRKPTVTNYIERILNYFIFSFIITQRNQFQRTFVRLITAIGFVVFHFYSVLKAKADFHWKILQHLKLLSSRYHFDLVVNSLFLHFSCYQANYMEVPSYIQNDHLALVQM